MKILRDDQVPAPPEVASYQETAWGTLLTAVVVLAIGLAIAAWPFLTGAWTNIWVAGPCLLAVLLAGGMARLALRSFFASRDRSNWLMRWSSRGLYVRFRSFQNYRFAADTPTVLFFDQKDIAWIRPYAKTLAKQDSDGDWTEQHNLQGLEIGLRQIDASKLSEVLRREAKRRDEKRFRFNHTPATLHPNGTLRVESRRPAVLLDALAARFPVAEYVTEASKRFDAMTTGEKDTHIRELAQAGDTIAAIKATREAYACNLTEAKRRLDGLTGR